MIKKILKNTLSKDSQRRLKQTVNKYKFNYIKKFHAYDKEKLKKALKEVGIARGDTLMVHSAYSRFSGFTGSPVDIIEALIEVVGEQGNVLMVSMPYRSSTAAYLKNNPVFDVQKTPSQMGIISEVFRKRRDVARSANPSHPLLVWGNQQADLINDHENCLYPCGPGSPFEKLHQLKGKILFFDVPFNTFTFIHYIEHLIKDDLPFNLYSDKPVCAKVNDKAGQVVDTNLFVFSEKAVKFRDPSILKKELEKNKLLKKTTIGKTTLMLVESGSVVECVNAFVAGGKTFYRMES